MPLSHELFQQNERHEAEEQGVGGLFLKAVGMGFGYHLVACHIEHGTAGEAQHHGEEGG